MAKRELSIKPSCAAQLFGFPPKRRDSLFEKVEQLLVDPKPDGKVRKALKGHPGVCRARVGDYRLFYSYGDGWVKLLAIRRREEKTYRNVMAAEEPRSPVGGAPELPPEPDDPAVLSFEASTAGDVETQEFGEPPQLDESLPRSLDAEWLRQLHVPVEHIPALVRCSSADALLDADVPHAVLDRVLNVLYPPELQEVLDEPDLLVPGISELGAWAEGELLSFLLRLDPEQEALTGWSLSGPTLVKGGAGTGKSTVALYRVKELLEHGEPDSRALFVTYTRALTRVSEQLLDQLLAPELRSRVQVSSVDQVTAGFAHRLGLRERVASRSQARKTLRELLLSFEPPSAAGFQRKLQARVLRQIPVEYLLDEFYWILSGRELGSVEEYLETSRSGRGRPFGAKLRHSVWDLHEAFGEALHAQGLTTWNALRSAATRALRSGELPRQYDMVLLDEAQDLPPTALALVAHLAKDAGGIFFAADDKQTLYGRGYSWSEVDPRLAFVGRTRILRKNYRSTRRLEAASFDALGGEHPDDTTVCVREGRLPEWVRGLSREGEAQAAARAIRELTRRHRLGTGSVAVLVHTHANGEWFADELMKRGVPARFFDGSTLDLTAREVKVMTLYSAKGLEFPIVVVAGLWPGSWPDRARFDSNGAYEEELSAHRRLLYVGLSRAMRGLVLLQASDCSDPVLESLQPEHWEIRS